MKHYRGTHINLARRAGVIGPIGAVDLALDRLKKHYRSKGMSLGQAAYAESTTMWTMYHKEVAKARNEMAGIPVAVVA